MRVFCVSVQARVYIYCRYILHNKNIQVPNMAGEKSIEEDPSINKVNVGYK